MHSESLTINIQPIVPIRWHLYFEFHWFCYSFLFVERYSHLGIWQNASQAVTALPTLCIFFTNTTILILKRLFNFSFLTLEIINVYLSTIPSPPSILTINPTFYTFFSSSSLTKLDIDYNKHFSNKLSIQRNKLNISRKYMLQTFPKVRLLKIHK